MCSCLNYSVIEICTNPRVSNYSGRVGYHSLFVAIYQSAVSYRHECLPSVLTFSSLHLVLQAEELDFSIVNEHKKEQATPSQKETSIKNSET